MNNEIKPSWNFLQQWSISKVPLKAHGGMHNWGDLEPLIDSARKVFQSYVKELTKMLKSSEGKLKHLNGDPINYNWNDFRPLRLTREEDWSDWLAFLIQSSSGGFNKYLLERPGFFLADYKDPAVEREVSFNGYRSDIIILWNNGYADHLEVKVGDPGLDKTYGTSAAMRRKYGSIINGWHDWILLLDSQIQEWEQVSDKESKHKRYADIEINYITWTDVAVAIRKTLYAKTESITWLSWAYAFTGAIETRLCGITQPSKLESRHKGFNLSNSVLSLQTILSRSMNSEKGK